MDSNRFHHAEQFSRWRPDLYPISCTLDQVDRAVAYDLDYDLSRGQAGLSYSLSARRFFDGCTRGGSPGIFGYSGGKGSSPRPASRSSCHQVIAVARVPTSASIGAHASPVFARISGTDVTVKACGSTSSNSSHRTGMDTGAPGNGRAEYAEAMVRSRFAWLKSTKIFSPRSSFHQAVVTNSGSVRSSRRAIAITPWRTSRNSSSGSTRAYTCNPREPDVFTWATNPASAITSRNACAAVTTSANDRPGCGSRSMRNSSGLSLFSVRTGQGWKVRAFICTAQTAVATSSIANWGWERPAG